MSPHRSKVTDDEIFAAVQRAMTRSGPHELTLADVAAEAGISPGRLVQRFGSKRALLLALSGRFAGSAGAVFGRLRGAHRGPVATLRAYATCMAGLAATPEALSRNLAYLQIDLTDPEFRAHLLANAHATRREIESLLRSAIDEGMLRATVDTRGLAGAIEAVISGSLMTWACYQEGSAAAWMRRHLDVVLKPHLSLKRSSKPSRSTSGSKALTRRRSKSTTVG